MFTSILNVALLVRYTKGCNFKTILFYIYIYIYAFFVIMDAKNKNNTMVACMHI